MRLSIPKEKEKLILLDKFFDVINLYFDSETAKNMGLPRIFIEPIPVSALISLGLSMAEIHEVVPILNELYTSKNEPNLTQKVRWHNLMNPNVFIALLNHTKKRIRSLSENQNSEELCLLGLHTIPVDEISMKVNRRLGEYISKTFVPKEIMYEMESGSGSVSGTKFRLNKPDERALFNGLYNQINTYLNRTQAFVLAGIYQDDLTGKKDRINPSEDARKLSRLVYRIRDRTHLTAEDLILKHDVVLRGKKCKSG